MLQTGQMIPNVHFVDETGAPVAAHSLLGASLVLFFYPKDETPGCVAEACAFRDDYESFVDAGATVIGVSSDDASSHARFKARHRLPFRLLSDPGAVARRAFGIPKTLGILPGRATFVIDADGRIRESFNSQFAPQRHVERASAVLASLRKGKE